MTTKRFRKYVEVDVDTRVDVTIDSAVIVDFLSQCNQMEFNDILQEVRKNVPQPAIEGITIKTPIDAMKFELIVGAFNKYSIFELEEKLK